MSVVPRFEAEGGTSSRLKARLAGPLLEVGSRLVSGVTAIGFSRMIHPLERAVARLAERLVDMRFDVEGLDNVDPDERYVVVALHEGFADALVLLHLPLRLRFAARDELFEWPALGRYLTAARHPRVDTQPSIASLRRFYADAVEVLADGDSLVLFAQGSILGVEVAFQPGAMRIARRLDRPILPVVVTGTHLVWEHPYSPRIRFGCTVSMRVLEPRPIGSLDLAGFRALERDMKTIALSPNLEPVRRFVPERDGWWDGYPYVIDAEFPELLARVERHRSGV